MNREIEFRAWLKDEKRMVAVVDLKFLTDHYGNRKEIVYWDETINSANYAYFDKIELMQYTGRIDKNMKKIFGKDIVKLNGYLWEVYWSDEESCWKIKNKLDDLFLTKYKEKALEVIGNIYENEELL